MGVFSFLKRNPLVVRYSSGSWEYSKNAANYLSQEYMSHYLNGYAVNACINIRATYLSKFKWGVQEKEGINYESDLLQVIKKPNVYQKSTVDFLKQFEVLRCVNGWVYQKTFGAKGFYPDALYNLNPSNIDFNSNKNPFLIWKKKDVNGIKDKEFVYDDNGTKKTYRFSEIMPFYDIANGIGDNENAMYTSPSKMQAILKSISNLDLALDAENIVEQTAGREAIYKDSKTATADSYGINGNKPLKDKELNDIRNKLNNKSALKGQHIRTFNPDAPISHLDMSLKPKDFDYDTGMSRNESIIARGFGVPNEIYQAWKQGSTFENQREAEVKFIDSFQEGVVKDLGMTWTDGFGDDKTPFVGTADHLRSLQNEENKKADTALRITQSLLNLQRSGFNESQAIDFMEGIGINLNS